MGLYWYFRECWILRGFRGILIGIKFKIRTLFNIGTSSVLFSHLPMQFLY